MTRGEYSNSTFLETSMCCRHTSDVSELIDDIVSTQRGDSKNWRNVQACVINSFLSVGRYALELETYVRQLEKKVGVLTSTVEALIHDAKLKEERYHCDVQLQNEAWEYWRGTTLGENDVSHVSEAAKAVVSRSLDPSEGNKREGVGDSFKACSSVIPTSLTSEKGHDPSNLFCSAQDSPNSATLSKVFNKHQNNATACEREINAIKTDLTSLRLEWKYFFDRDASEFGKTEKGRKAKRRQGSLYCSPVFSYLKKANGHGGDSSCSFREGSRVYPSEKMRINSHCRWLWSGYCSLFQIERPIPFDSILKLGVDNTAVRFTSQSSSEGSSSEDSNQSSQIKNCSDAAITFFSWPSKEAIVVKVPGLYKVIAGVTDDAERIFSSSFKEFYGKERSPAASFNNYMDHPSATILIYINGEEAALGDLNFKGKRAGCQVGDPRITAGTSFVFSRPSSRSSTEKNARVSSGGGRRGCSSLSRYSTQRTSLRSTTSIDGHKCQRASTSIRVVEGYLHISENSMVELRLASISKSKTQSRCFLELEFLA